MGSPFRIEAAGMPYSGSARRADFNYFGTAAEILERLRGLPDDSGPEAIRSEFGRGH
jgi:hypothetical protein